MALSTEHRDEGALLGRPLRDGRRAQLRGGNRAPARNPARRRPRTRAQRRTAVALGTIRDRDYADYYANAKRRERQAAHEHITQWEMDHYLQLYQSGVGLP